MLHPDTTLKFVNPIIGSGIFANEYIPKGTLTYVKDALEIELTPEQYDQKEKEIKAVVDKYSYIDENGHYIVSWDNAKYINHCCEPNTISTGYGFEIAIKDIYPGDEITDDYGMFNLEQAFTCECGAPECRKRINPEDLDTLSKKWDEKIKPALENFDKVRQPLLQYLDKNIISQVLDYLNNPQTFKTVKSLKFVKDKVYAS